MNEQLIEDEIIPSLPDESKRPYKHTNTPANDNEMFLTKRYFRTLQSTYANNPAGCLARPDLWADNPLANATYSELAQILVELTPLIEQLDITIKSTMLPGMLLLWDFVSQVMDYIFTLYGVIEKSGNKVIAIHPERLDDMIRMTNLDEDAEYQAAQKLVNRLSWPSSILPR